MRQSIRILALYEAMGGTSILGGRELSEDDIVRLLHSYLCVKSGSAVSGGALKEIMEDSQNCHKLMGEVEDFLAEQSTWGELVKNSMAGDKAEATNITINSVVGLLVIECGISPKYVMDEMELWEVAIYVGGLNEKQKKRLEEKRLFTFIGISPWLGNSGKNLTPQDVIKFPWDDDTPSDSQAFVEQNYNELHKILNGTANTQE